MKIQMLFFEGCPHHEPTLTLLREVAAELGIAAEIETVEVTDSDAVQDLRFFGSPTVQVNGVDIEPAARSDTNYAYGCRMYGTSGTPTRDLVRAAFEEARAA